MTVRSFASGALIGQHMGSGAPSIVALHGWGRDRCDLRRATEGLPTLALDLPGFGSSPAPPATWGAREYADFVAEGIREFVGAPLVVLGHSFGGRVGLCLAAGHPDLVSALVLCGVPLVQVGRKIRPALAYRALRTAHRVHLVGDTRLERWRQRYGSADYRLATGVMREVLTRVVNETYEAELTRVTQPVALVWGAGDTTVPVSVAERARSLLAGPVELDVVEEAGHDVHRDAPERVRAHVTALTTRVTP